MLTAWLASLRRTGLMIALLGLPTVVLHPACAEDLSSDDNDGDDGSDSGDGDGAGGGGGQTAQPLAMTVLSAERALSVGDFDPAEGENFFVLSVSLENNTGAALPLAYPFFSIELDSGLAFAADLATDAHPGACPASASLTDGSTLDCTVVFSAPRLDTAERLVYTAPDGTRYDAAVTMEPCVECGQVCLPSECTCQNGRTACVPTTCEEVAEYVELLHQSAYGQGDEACAVNDPTASCEAVTKAGCGAEYMAVFACLMVQPDEWQCTQWGITALQSCADELQARDACLQQ